MALVVKNLLANAGDVRYLGSIPESGRPPEKGMATPSSILARKILWTEEPGKLHSMRSKKSRTEAAEQVRHLFVEIDY